jgi:hypothetical protein
MESSAWRFHPTAFLGWGNAGLKVAISREKLGSTYSALFRNIETAIRAERL